MWKGSIRPRFLQQLESFFSIEATEVSGGVPPGRLEELLQRNAAPAGRGTCGHGSLGCPD